MENIEDLKKRFEKLYPIEGLGEGRINKIETVLGVKLPDDFKGIAGISIFDSYAPNITDETLRLRNVINLSQNFLVIAEPPASIILLDTKNTPAVIWFDSTEIDKLHDMSFINPPDIWDTFSKFFL